MTKSKEKESKQTLGTLLEHPKIMSWDYFYFGEIEHEYTDRLLFDDDTADLLWDMRMEFGETI